MIMRPQFELHHCGLSVVDLDQSMSFYCDVLGFEADTVTEVNEDFKIVHMKKGGSYIELFWLRGSAALPEHAARLNDDLAVIGTKHMAFITEDIFAMHGWLVEKNVQVESEVMTNNEDYNYFFFKDPNGILLEMVERKDAP